MIEVTFDSRKRLVRAVMGGLLTVEEIELFSKKKQEAVRVMGLDTGKFFLLVETLGNLVQNQAVATAFQQLMLNSPLKAKRIATVRAGALPTLQARRIAAVRESAQVFETIEDAEAWLFS